MLRVLVLGGAGFIGRHASAALVARGHEVVVGTRRPARAAKRLPPRLHGCERREVRFERLCTPEAWEPLLRGGCAASTPWSTRSASCASAARGPTPACTISRRRPSPPLAPAAQSALSTFRPSAFTPAHAAASSARSSPANGRSPRAARTTASCGRRSSTARAVSAPPGSATWPAGPCISCLRTLSAARPRWMLAIWARP